jgi:tetratricopeptide (TPR) repeat protein
MADLLVNLLVIQGMYEEAIAEHKKGIALDKTSRRAAQLGYTYATAGKRDEALKIIDELKEAPKEQYVTLRFCANLHWSRRQGSSFHLPGKGL